MVKEHNKATEERKEKDNMHGACDAGAMIAPVQSSVTEMVVFLCRCEIIRIC